MGVSGFIPAWSVLRQIRGKDRFALGRAAQSARQAELAPRTRRAEVTKSICPYCAVGCGQRVYVEDGRVTQIEGDPESPISRGASAPKAPPPKTVRTPGWFPAQPMEISPRTATAKIGPLRLEGGVGATRTGRSEREGG